MSLFFGRLPLFFLFILVVFPFDKGVANSKSPLTFHYTPIQVQTLCQVAKEKLNNELKQVAQVREGEETFRNTVGAFEQALGDFTNQVSPVTFLKDVSPMTAVREAAALCDTEVQKLLIDVYARSDLYQVLQNLKKKNLSFSSVDSRLFDEHLALFKRNGLALPENKQKEFLSKKKRLVEVEEKFNKRLGEWKDELIVSKDELSGLPEDYIQNLKKKESDRYRIPLDYPHYFTFMDNAKSADTRRRLQAKFFNRGGEENKELLEEAIRLRAELAHLLGYKNHAEFVLERRMAKKSAEVSAFLNRLEERLLKKGKENLRELLEAKREDLKDPKADKIYSWDWRYYENYLRRTKYHVDPQQVREYFPLDVVLKGMFDIYQTLFHVKFIEEKGAEVWHPSVRLYRIERNKKTIGYFYMDLFPREGKYSHAAAFQLVSGYEKPNRHYLHPVSAIVANFDAPSSARPSLLPHDTVETLFHEFGHIMHQTLTLSKYVTFSGTNVKTDFVEAPSQMLQNWVWKSAPLEKISSHFKNPKKKLPKDLIEKMVKAKWLNIGIRYLRQLGFAKIDIAYHTADNVDSTAIYRRISQETMLISIPDGTLPQASFGHLMGGYDAGYYGYLWSEVYAEDMFSRFDAEGLLNPKTGAEYVVNILEPGGTREPLELVTAFLKREPNEKAFLKHLGLDAETEVSGRKSSAPSKER